MRGKKHSKTGKKKPVESQNVSFFKKAWNFIWNDDSAASWIANVVLAFILIKFVVYPLLSLFLGTQLPVVAVISESMSHSPTPICDQRSLFTGDCISYQDEGYEICSKAQDKQSRLSFEKYWNTCGIWYENMDVSKEDFMNFKLSGGFEKGDVIVLGKADPEKLEIGDILVFVSNLDPDKARPYPIIHRIVDIQETSQGKVFSTKGDHNGYQIVTSTFNEDEILESQILGKGIGRIPYVGYVKIWFVNLLQSIGLAN